RLPWPGGARDSNPNYLCRCRRVLRRVWVPHRSTKASIAQNLRGRVEAHSRSPSAHHTDCHAGRAATRRFSHFGPPLGRTLICMEPILRAVLSLTSHRDLEVVLQELV